MIQKRPRAAKMGPLGRTEETKRRNGVILVVAATVLVAGIVVGGILLLTGGSSDDEPTTVAREFAEIYQRGLNTSGRDVNVDDFEPLVCKEYMQQLRDAFAAKENPVPGAPQFTLTVKDVTTEGDKGKFTMGTRVTAPGTPEQNEDEPFDLVKEDGDWRVCGL
ncbi:hypothetical protein DMH04_33295 [Kibdelosporangium aridum]|uniref:Low molecular weight antigen MTB12-like C-terminal domain-containing protein n=1 Tax=Kibdelosporangium aridum TaxID=2030 RepID=A0A428Z151_KIBAR|nr:hypothetical protein [Kibdelosporangium aridum]RSM78540.1 hypothetical protein DMH04_33295 [Kibdelosporangium aridum]